MKRENEFVNYNGFLVIASKVNSRLKKAETLPAKPSDNEVVFYCGENTDDYTKGHIYQAIKQNSNFSWIDITPVSTKQFHLTSAKTIVLPQLANRPVRLDVLYKNSGSWKTYSCWANSEAIVDIVGENPDLSVDELNSFKCIKAEGSWQEMFIDIMDETASLATEA